MIDKIMEEGEDEKGQSIFRIRWYGFAAADDTWEPAEGIPAPLIARFRKNAARRKENRRISFAF